MKTNRIIKLTSLFSVLFAAFLSSGCEKSANTTVYEWSATIDGVNYSYSTISTTGGTSNGGAAIFNTSPINGTSKSNFVLLDDGGWPQFNFVSGATQFTVGTYILDSQSSGLPVTDVQALNILISSSNMNSQYSSLMPNARVTLNITSVGNVGGTVEGNFSGTVGLLSNGNLVNISGTFKTYRGS